MYGFAPILGYILLFWNFVWQYNYIKFIFAKYTIQWIFYIHNFVQPQNSKYHPPKKTLLISNYSQFSFSANPQMYFLSLLMCLLWTFHINRITECVLICVWLLLFGEMCLRIIHAVPRVNTSCPLRLDSIPVCGWITFSIIQLTDEPSRFSPFAPMNNAAICTGIQVSASARVFNSAGFIPRSGIASSQGNSLTFRGSTKLFSEVSASLYISVSGV